MMDDKTKIEVRDAEIKRLRLINQRLGQRQEEMKRRLRVKARRNGKLGIYRARSAFGGEK